MSVEAAPVPGKAGAPKIKASDRSQDERRLGWKLVAPAVIMMLLVTA